MGVIQISSLSEGLNGMLGIWKLGESSSELLHEFSFSERELMKFNQFSNEKRKCEFLAVRLLLQNMLREKKELLYTSSGKPYLESNLHISISHSAELVVIILTDIPVGIDVESLNRKTEKIAPRFLADAELQHINNTPNPSFTRMFYWCAKEALFKCTPMDAIEFKSQILINPFQPDAGHGMFNGRLIKNNLNVNFVFQYLTVINNVIVYCTEKA